MNKDWKIPIKSQALFTVDQFYIGNTIYSKLDIIHALNEKFHESLSDDTKIVTGMKSNDVIHLYNKICGFNVKTTSANMVYIEYLHGYILIDDHNKNETKYNFTNDFDHFVEITYEIYQDILKKHNYDLVCTTSYSCNTGTNIMRTQYQLVKRSDDICLN